MNVMALLMGQLLRKLDRLSSFESAGFLVLRRRRRHRSFYFLFILNIVTLRELLLAPGFTNKKDSMSCGFYAKYFYRSPAFQQSRNLWSRLGTIDQLR